MAVARLQGAHVTLTDVPWLLPLTRLNVEANFDGEREMARPVVAPLRWGSASDIEKLSGLPPELLIGSDIVYEELAVKPLLDTMTQLRSRHAIFAVGWREGGAALSFFLRAAAEGGWYTSLLAESRTAKVVRLIRPEPPKTAAQLSPTTPMAMHLDAASGRTLPSLALPLSLDSPF